MVSIQSQETALTPGQFDAAPPISQPVEEEPPKEVAPTPSTVVQPEVGVPTGNVVIQTDQRAEEITQEQEAALADITKQFTLAEEEKKVLEAEKATFEEKRTKESEVKAAGGLTFDEATEQFGKDFTGVIFDEASGLFIPDASAIARRDLAAQEVANANDEINKEFDSVISELDTLRTTLSGASQALVDSIKASYAIRKDQTRDVNKRALEGLRILGIRSGRSRFAGEIQTSILSSEERAGIARLAQLDAEESSLIAQAEVAAAEKDFELLNAKMNLIGEKRQAKADQAEALRKMTKDAEEFALKKAEFDLKFNESLAEQERDFIDDVSLSVLDQALNDDGTINEKFLDTFATNNGLDPDKLKSSVLEQMNDLTRKGLDIENIKSQIESRKNQDRINAENLRLKIEEAEREETQMSSGLKAAIDKLPVGQQDSAFSAVATIKGAQRILALLDEGIATGPAVGRLKAGTEFFGLFPLTPGATTFGLSSDETNDFIAASTVFTANFIKAISGAQVSDKERTFLENALPSIKKQEALNISGIKIIVETLKDKYETQLGIDFDDFADELKVETTEDGLSLEDEFNQFFTQ